MKAMIGLWKPNAEMEKTTHMVPLSRIHPGTRIGQPGPRKKKAINRSFTKTSGERCNDMSEVFA
jgi:hypothetical protein